MARCPCRFRRHNQITRRWTSTAGWRPLPLILWCVSEPRSHQRRDASHRGQAIWKTHWWYILQLLQKETQWRGSRQHRHLQHVLRDCDPEDIYNLDETGLFYRYGPNYTLATKTVSGTKTSKDRITVALAANAIGTTKIKPFVITKVQRPICFAKSYNPECYVRYPYNDKTWMTQDLSKEWLKDFDRNYYIIWFYCLF